MNNHSALLTSLDKVITYVTSMDRSVAQADFFGDLKSLRTLLWFNGHSFNPEDAMIHGLGHKLSSIAASLETQMEESDTKVVWPFTPQDEQYFLEAITHLGSVLNTAQSQLQSTRVHTDTIAVATESSTEYSHPAATVGMYMSYANSTISGNVGGSVFSNNRIHVAADPNVGYGVGHLVRSANDADLDKKHTTILNWLSGLNFESTQRDTFAKHADETGNWFLTHEKFLDWKNGKSKLLWCPGKPGVGKTVLSSIIVEHLLSSTAGSDIAVAYIYCDYTQQKDQTSIQLLGSILKQLVQRHRSLSDPLMTLYEQCSSRHAIPTVAELIAAIAIVITTYSRVYLVVDALDECSERGQRIFSSTDPNCGLRSLLGKLHLLITSRDIPCISDELIGQPSLEIEAHTEDLAAYIKDRIAHSDKLLNLVRSDPPLELEIIIQVISRAAGMFLQAHLHMDSLTCALTRTKLRATLESLPKELTASYDTAMKRINLQGVDLSTIAYKVFSWLAFACRPLRSKELQHAISVSANMNEMDFDDVIKMEWLTDICAGLIVVQNDAALDSDHQAMYGFKVSLVHYTTQEYFQSNQQHLFPSIHSSMAITCLTYLSFGVFETNDSIAQLVKNQYPFYDYSSHYWGIHAYKDESSQVIQHCLQFLEKDLHVAHSSAQCDQHEMTGKLHILARYGLSQTMQFLLEDCVMINSYNQERWTPLCYAVRFGNINVVRVLLDKGADTNIPTLPKSNTPLSLAAQYGQAEIVETLLEHKADLDSADSDRRTPLSYAAEGGYPQIVELLLKKNANPDAADFRQWPPLSYAIDRNHVGVAKLLLAHGSDVNVTDNREDTPLIYAAIRNNPKAVELLLAEGADPDAADWQQCTPLYHAAINGHLQVAKLLLAHGANVNVGDSHQRSPLPYAAGRGHHYVVKLLVEHGSNVNATDFHQRAPLSYAAGYGDLEAVELLLAEGSEYDAVDCKKRTSLSYAAEGNHLEIVRLLLAKGANCNAVDSDQRTPLIYATDRPYRGLGADLVLVPHSNTDTGDSHPGLWVVKDRSDVNAADSDQQGTTLREFWGLHDDLEVVKLLVAHGSNVNDADSRRRTPLSYAAAGGDLEVVKLLLAHGSIVSDAVCEHATSYGHPEIVKLLVEHRSSINAANTDQQIALLSAARDGDLEAVKILLVQPLNVNVAGSNQRTPLIYAVRHGDFEMVKLLLAEGANPNAADSEQCTPLLHAVMDSSLENVKLLLAHGADVDGANSDMSTPLVCAITYGHVEIVEHLLAQGSNPNGAHSDKYTPLCCAASLGQYAVVKVLLAHHADVNAVDSDQDTALICGATSGHVEIVKLLLTQGPNLDLTNSRQRTSLMHAAYEGHSEIVELLLTQGCNPNVTALNDKCTALFCAVRAERCDLKVVKLLLGHGANPDATDSDQCTPLFYAARSGMLDIVKLLLQYATPANVYSVISKLEDSPPKRHQSSEMIDLLEQHIKNERPAASKNLVASKIISSSVESPIMRLIDQMKEVLNGIEDKVEEEEVD